MTAGWRSTIALGCLGCLLMTAACSSPADAERDVGVGAPTPSTVKVADGLRSFRSTSRSPTVPIPVQLRIPTIDVDTPLERLGQAPDGTIQVPVHWQQAGWYQDGPRPGEPGAAVILGHVDSPTGPAVFADLSSLHAGDPIRLRRADGSTVSYRVTHTELRRRNRFPLTQVYTPTLRPELRLITCGGPYLRSRGGYQSNVIVFAVSDHNGEAAPSGPGGSRGD